MSSILDCQRVIVCDERGSGLRPASKQLVALMALLSVLLASAGLGQVSHRASTAVADGEAQRVFLPSVVRNVGVGGEMISMLGGFTSGFDANERIAILAVGSRIEILETRAPGSPRRLASFETESAVLDALLQGDRVYALGRTSPKRARVTVVDVATSSRPQHLGQVEFDLGALTLHSAYSPAISIDEDRLFVVGGSLHLIDVANPTRPIELTTLDLRDDVGHEGVQHVVVGTHLVTLVRRTRLEEPGFQGLIIVDVADPSSPFVTGRWPLLEIDQGSRLIAFDDRRFAITRWKGWIGFELRGSQPLGRIALPMTGEVWTVQGNTIAAKSRNILRLFQDNGRKFSLVCSVPWAVHADRIVLTDTRALALNAYYSEIASYRRGSDCQIELEGRLAFPATP